MSPVWIHATALAFGGRGVLILGPSGAGKSALALALIEAARLGGQFARLVGDDRVSLKPAHGRLIARGHPAIAGRIERRGSGVEATPQEPACALSLVVDLGAPAERLPDPALRRVLEGVALPVLAVGGLQPSDIPALVIARLRAIAPN